MKIILLRKWEEIILTSDIAISMENIEKHYGGIYAIQDVSLILKRGSVHALVGENGAGKSTLMKILTGVVKKDKGRIILNEQEVDIHSYAHSIQLGIALVPQELSLVEYFTVGENIFLGREPQIKGTKLINWRLLFENTKELLESLKINLDPKKKVKDLSVSEKQMLVIARSLSLDAQVIVFDEPTARLGHHEVKQLLDYIHYLKNNGKSIIYISHRLEEIFQIADEVTVLRDGKVTGNMNVSNIDESGLIQLMVNRQLACKTEIKTNHTIGEEVFRVENITRGNVVNDVSFSIRKGEVLGFFGIVGSGRTETFRAILGVDKRDSGRIILENQEIRLKSMYKSLKCGIALVPEERRQQGLVLSRSIRTNVTLGSLERFSVFGFVSTRKEKLFVSDTVDRMRLVRRNIEQNASDLSGGNQQKVVLSKFIGRGGTKLFILDEPTRGIDVGAKSEIYTLIDGIAVGGTPVVVISSEIPELQTVCDRIIVMKRGKIVANLEREEFCDAQNILKYAIGG